MSSPRKVRLENQIRDIVSSILLFELQDPRLGFTTVTAVELSRDLRRAVIKVSVLGDERQRTVTMNVIRHARGYVQKLLAGKLRVKYLPAISFEEDESVRKSVGLSKMLRDAREVTDDGGEEEE
ncbi:MAG: 30S ribosome-binding factor RbfA [Planctomycetota bacterium]|jgi:ribosome-binding factor A